MPISVQEYQRLKEMEAELVKEVEQGRGGLRELKRRLKKEFGCSTAAEAKALSAKLAKKEKRLEAEVRLLMKGVEDVYADRLEG